MESGDGAVIADPDVGSVGAVAEGFGGEGDGSRDVWQKWREFAVQVVIFYIYLDFREKKKNILQTGQRLTGLGIFDRLVLGLGCPQVF